MHDTALQNGKRFFDTYLTGLGRVRVADVGALDVNGSLRDVCPDGVEYIGVDFVPGNGVDVVLTDPYRMPFDNESLDVVVSSSCFEHSEMFWLLFLEILRVLRPAGIFYLNAPSNGSVHRYPVDCYRFYPDSGNALARWGRRSGYRPAVLECYTSNRLQDVWNDYVCVFLKDETHVAAYPHRIVHSFSDFRNGLVYPDLETFVNFEATV
jgi:SAM-dependent methyltransferase